MIFVTVCSIKSAKTGATMPSMRSAQKETSLSDSNETLDAPDASTANRSLSPVSAIVAFMNGEGPDDAGRRIADVLGFDDVALEHHHDFIQWLFPLPEASRAVRGSPVLTPDDQMAISGSSVALANLAAAARRLSDFYDRTEDWLQARDHNHLRISRIIRSLRLLMGDTAANRFREARLTDLVKRGGRVNDVSLAHWRRS